MNITLSVSGKLEELVRRHPEIKWTEIARRAMAEESERLMKLSLLANYLDKKPISDSDWEWMEAHDWHPVDEKPLKKSFVESLEKSRKEKPIKVKSIGSLFK